QQIASSLPPVLIAPSTPALFQVLVNFPDEAEKKASEAMAAAQAVLGKSAGIISVMHLGSGSMDSNEGTNDNLFDLNDYRSILRWLGGALYECARGARSPKSPSWVLEGATRALP